MQRFALRLAAVGFALGVALSAGCTAKPPANKPKDGHDHDHEEVGPHKGPVAEWGEHEYHVEFTVDHDAKEATVYIYDDNLKNSKPIKAKQITISLKEQPPVTFTLDAKPQEGDPAGTASRVVGKHDALAAKKEFAGTVSAEVDGKKYSGEFKE